MWHSPTTKDGESGLIQNRTLQLEVPCLNDTNIFIPILQFENQKQCSVTVKDRNIIF